MRLIDADALRQHMVEWKDTDRPWKSRADYATAIWDAVVIIDDAQTISCDQCRHGITATTSDGVEAECQRTIGSGISSWNKPDFGCSRFEVIP